MQFQHTKLTASYIILLFLDFSLPVDIVEKIRQLYGTREQRLLPVPWCDDFSFHLNEIFTRLKIVSKDKTRGDLSDDITNMTAIFKPHAECQRPRTVLLEGDPGMGKSTYCQKLAYDWATKQEQWDTSFPKIEVLLLLRCHEIRSTIWEAIDDQILPAEIDDQTRECFFRFVRENQPKVLFLLDGVDEMDSSQQQRIFDLVEGKELSGCHVVLTSCHEVGRKVRRYCDTLWEIVGFSEEDAKSFICTYFRKIKKEHLAENLTEKIWNSYEPEDLDELTKNPLNVTLLCILCEDFEGVFPASRTQLYTEIVLCVLRRYERKQGLSSKNEDLMSIYKDDLINLGRVALQSLRKGELHFEEHESGGTFVVLSKFGFLSLQSSISKRKTCVRYAFLHKSFQEFFSGFYLACQILDGEIECDSVVTDESFQSDLWQVFMFMTGILASKSERTAESLVQSMAEKINLIHVRQRGLSGLLLLALDCVSECTSLVQSLGKHLNLTDLYLNENEIDDSFASSLSHTLAANSSLTCLDLSGSSISSAGVSYISQALAVNSTLASLFFIGNGNGGPAFDSLSQALASNSSLTHLDLSRNLISPSGVASLSRALASNSSLTHLDLSRNLISPSGVASLSRALGANSSLTNLNLRVNHIRNSGVACLSQGLAANSFLTILNLRSNKITDSGATSLSHALAATSLTNLDLSRNWISDTGSTSLSQALAVNSSLTRLDLSRNWIGDSGATSLSQALAANSSLTSLNLRWNRIGDSGAVSFFQAVAGNSYLTSLNLRGNLIGDACAASLSHALAANSSLTSLDLSHNEIGDSGATSFSQALVANSSLTCLKLRWNRIGPSGTASLSQAFRGSSPLKDLDLTGNVTGFFLSTPILVYPFVAYWKLFEESSEEDEEEEEEIRENRLREMLPRNSGNRPIIDHSISMVMEEEDTML